jgi:hypothetical protein
MILSVTKEAGAISGKDLVVQVRVGMGEVAGGG